MSYGIIADDLTGSCDVAGRLTQLGYRPIIVVRPLATWRAFVPLRKVSRVLVLNTRSRDCRLQQASPARK